MKTLAEQFEELERGAILPVWLTNDRGAWMVGGRIGEMYRRGLYWPCEGWRIVGKLAGSWREGICQEMRRG